MAFYTSAKNMALLFINAVVESGDAFISGKMAVTPIWGSGHIISINWQLEFPLPVALLDSSESCRVGRLDDGAAD